MGATAMNSRKTKIQLIEELKTLRKQLAKAEKAEAKDQQSEEALRESEKRFRLLFDMSPLSYQSLDADGCFLEVNPTWLKLLGYTREEVIGRWFGDFMALEYVDHFRVNFPRFKVAGEIHNVQFEMIRKNGQRILVEFDGQIGYDEHGEFKQTHCVFQDISERKRVEERQILLTQALELLNKSSEKVDVIRDLLLLIKKYTGFEAVGIRLRNGEDFPYFETKGFPKDFIEAENYLCSHKANGELLRDAEGNPHLECMCGNILCGRTDPSLPFFTENGSFWTNSTTDLLASFPEKERTSLRNRCNRQGYESMALIPLRSSNETIGLLQLNDSRKGMFTLEMISFFEGFGASIGIALDNKQAGEALRESEVNNQAILNAVPDLMFQIDRDGTFLNCKSVPDEALALPRSEFLGKNIRDVFPTEFAEQTMRYVWQTLQGNEVPIFEYKMLVPNGELRDFEARFTACGETVLIITRDITERKHAEEALRYRYEFEGLIADISTQLINLPPDEIENEITRALRMSGEFVDVDRSYVFLFCDNGTKLNNTHEWCAEGIEPQINNLKELNADIIPWWMDKLKRFENIHIPCVADLPPEANAEKEILEMQGIQSLVVVPMICSDSLIGFLGFDSVRSEREWSEDTVILLRMMGNVIANALERKRVEEALQESERRFRDLADLLPQIVFEIDLKGNFIFVNRCAFELFGYTKDDIDKNLNNLQMLVPEDRERAKENTLRILSGEDSHGNEYMALRKDGSTFPIIIYSSPIVREGMPVGLRGIIVDITERKHAEEALRESEERERSILKNYPDFVLIVDSEEKIQFINHPEQAGYTMEQTIGRSVYDFVAPEHHDAHRENIAQVLQKGESSSIETTALGHDGRGRCFITRFAPMNYGGQVAVMLCATDITKRKRTEEALLESEKRYRFLIEKQAEGIVIVDPDERFIFNNPAAEEIFGVSKGMLLHKNLTEFTNAETFEMIRQQTKERHAGVKSAYEIEIIWPSGEKRQILVTATPWIDEKEDFAGAFAIFRDITDRKLAEEALRESEERYRDLFENASDLIQCVDADGNFVYVNRRWRDVLGYSEEEIRTMNLMQIIHPDHFQACMDMFKRVCQGETLECVETVFLSKDEGEITVEGTVNAKIKDGKFIASRGIFRDITDRRKFIEALRKAHEHNEQLLASISSLLIGVRQDDRITNWNEAAENAFGISAGDAIGQQFFGCGIRWNWKEVAQHISDFRRENRSSQLNNIRYTRPDGRDGFLNLTVNPFLEGQNGQRGFLLIGEDITEQKILESQLGQAQKLESIGQLAAGIAHEINTPTQYVGDNTHFLQDAFNDLDQLLGKYNELLDAARKEKQMEAIVQDVEKISEKVDVDYLLEEVPKAIGQTLEGVERVAKIVRAMKEFSHPGVEEKSTIDINSAIKNTIAIARNEWKYVAEMVTDLDPSLPMVLCLAGDINQAVLNVIINGAQAIADVVGDTSKDKGTITVRTRREGDWAEIRISDTGTGIPEALRDKVFDPFFTTKEVGKGTGQGLAITHSAIVKKHGGTITFESEEGKGTTFIIRLPLANGSE